MSVIETNSEEEADWSVGMRLQLAPRWELAYFVVQTSASCTVARSPQLSVPEPDGGCSILSSPKDIFLAPYDVARLLLLTVHLLRAPTAACGWMPPACSPTGPPHVTPHLNVNVYWRDNVRLIRSGSAGGSNTRAGRNTTRQHLL